LALTPSGGTAFDTYAEEITIAWRHGSQPGDTTKHRQGTRETTITTKKNQTKRPEMMPNRKR
jgi:hypothetical protein